MPVNMIALKLITDDGRAARILHPVRRRVLEALESPDSAAGLARRLGIPRQLANYHIVQLESDGLVELVEERRAGNMLERVFRATAQMLLIAPGALGKLAADPARVADHFSAAYLAAVAARTIQDLAELRPRADAAGKKLPTLTLDTEVRFASAAAQTAFADELADALTRIAQKYHDPRAAAGRSFRFFAGAYPLPAPSTARSTEV